MLACAPKFCGDLNSPGDTMKMTGSVTAMEGKVATIAIRGANSLGDHVNATVEVELS